MPASPESGAVASVGMLQNQQSLMLRAGDSRRADEVQEMNRQKFEIMRPVLESEARVQLVSEAAALSVAKQTNDYVAEITHSIPVLTQEWIAIQKISEPRERLRAQSEFIGRTAPLANVPSAKPMVEKWQNAYAQDSNNEKANAVIAGRADVTAAGNDAKMQIAAEKNQTALALKEKDIAMREADLKAKQEKFEQAQAHAKEIAQMRDETTRRGQDIAQETKTSQLKAMNDRPANIAARKTNDAILLAGQSAAQEVQKVDQALGLLEDPELRTGTGAGFVAAVKKLGGLFGADTGNVKNLEQLQSIFGDTLLARAKQLKGTISDKDVKLLEGMSPSVARTPEGNRTLLMIVKTGLLNQLNAASLVQEGRTPGSELPETEVQWNVNNYFRDLPPLIVPDAAPATFTPEKEARLQELKAKQAARGR